MASKCVFTEKRKPIGKQHVEAVSRPNLDQACELTLNIYNVEIKISDVVYFMNINFLQVSDRILIKVTTQMKTYLSGYFDFWNYSRATSYMPIMPCWINELETSHGNQHIWLSRTVSGETFFLLNALIYFPF